MSDEEIVQEQEAPVQEEQAQQVESKPEIKETRDEINWRQANEVMRLQKQRLDELERERQDWQRQQQKPVEEPDEFEGEDPDDYITVEKARRMADKAAEKKSKAAVQQALQEYSQNQNLNLSEQKAREKYEDYDYVMQTYVLPMIKNDPVLAYKIQHSKDPAATAYKLGKLSDDYEDNMAEKTVSPKAEKILKNSQRPTSSNAAGSLKTQADKYANMSQAEIWAESQKYARKA